MFKVLPCSWYEEGELDEDTQCAEYDYDEVFWSEVVVQKQYVDSELDPYKHHESGELARV